MICSYIFQNTRHLCSLIAWLLLNGTRQYYWGWAELRCEFILSNMLIDLPLILVYKILGVKMNAQQWKFWFSFPNQTQIKELRSQHQCSVSNLTPKSSANTDLIQYNHSHPNYLHPPSIDYNKFYFLWFFPPTQPPALSPPAAFFAAFSCSAFASLHPIKIQN